MGSQRRIGWLGYVSRSSDRADDASGSIANMITAMAARRSEAFNSARDGPHSTPQCCLRRSRARPVGSSGYRGDACNYAGQGAAGVGIEG
jgi:hypothetical protein